MYEDQQEIAFAGMKVDSGDDRVESFPCAAAIPFGRVVATNPATAQTSAVDNSPIGLPAAPFTRTRGVSLQSHTASYAGTAPSLGYAQYDCASVMTRGLAWVEAAAATAITLNSQLLYDAFGRAVAAAGTAFEGAIVRGPVQTLANGQFIVPVELHSPMDADAVV